MLRLLALLAAASLAVACGRPPLSLRGPSSPGVAKPSAPTTRPTSTPRSADGRLSRVVALADVEQLVSLLEGAHPDPYAGGGGRVAFHRQVAAIRAAIPAGGLSAEALLRLLAPLIASLGDGHTTIDLPRGSARGTGARTRSWVDLDLAGEAIYVRRVYGAQARRYLGWQVVAVEGIAIYELRARMRGLRGADNRNRNLVHLMESIERPAWLARLLGRATPPTTLRIQVSDGRGGRAAFSVPIGARAPGRSHEPASKVRLPKLDAAGMGWGFIRPDVALLRIGSMMRYREAFEVWRGTRFVSNLGQHLDRVAAAAVGAEAASRLTSVDAKIAAVPAVSDALLALRREMRRREVTKLVVDLRDNAGGNSLIVAILEAALVGTEGVGAQVGYQVPRISQLFFESYKRDPKAELARRGLRLGDYDFSQLRAWRRGGAGSRARFIKRARELSPTFARLLDRLRGGSSPRLELAVITSARTYSAAFDVAATLYRRGATIVGVGSSQAGNCFIDTLPYALRHSRLRGGISFKRSVRFPNDPRAGKLLAPAVPLRYRDLVARAFDPNSSALLAAEALAARAPRRRSSRVRLRFAGPADGALALLRERYALAAVAGAGGELARLTRLRDWVQRRWFHHSTNRPPRADALSILAAAELGQRFRCVEYAIVLAQVYRALGYCARLVRLEGRGAHVLTEVYAPKLGKWVLMDPQLAAHVTRGGVPQSAEELVRLGTAGTVAHVGGLPDKRYLPWLAPYLEVLMVPVDMSYGRELDALAVLLNKGRARPARKPPYLRETVYRYTRDPRALYPRCRSR